MHSLELMRIHEISPVIEPCSVTAVEHVPSGPGEHTILGVEFTVRGSDSLAALERGDRLTFDAPDTSKEPKHYVTIARSRPTRIDSGAPGEPMKLRVLVELLSSRVYCPR